MLDKLDRFDFSLLAENQRGIERETLRVDPKGKVVNTAHPSGLGEKLTNGFVTVDFSEGLLELITPPFTDQGACFGFLKDATAYTQQSLYNNEIMWAGSMPPDVTEDEIEIATFGSNPSAEMKQVYREGLALRYGKTMQVISGIHYNFSISEKFLDRLEIEGFSGSLMDRKSYLYFRLIKRYYQLSWILPYLFGCSPVCAKSLASNGASYLQDLDETHYVGEYATSLRMSDLGYQSKAQESLFISCEDVQSYAHDLLKATDTRYSDYIRFGVKDENGTYLQLNDNILQIENEYYNTIRPKQIAKCCERPACALLKRGVEYMEVRLLDVDIFSEVGIAEETGLFVEVFLMLCMLASELEYNETLVLDASDNFEKVVKQGRKPGLALVRNGESKNFKDWGEDILKYCMVIAKYMDNGLAEKGEYQKSVQAQIEKLQDVSLTPSARVLREVEIFNGSYHDWLLDKSAQHAAALLKYDIPMKSRELFDQQVQDSIEAWQKMEDADMGSFEDYIAGYFNSACG